MCHIVTNQGDDIERYILRQELFCFIELYCNLKLPSTHFSITLVVTSCKTLFSCLSVQLIAEACRTHAKTGSAIKEHAFKTKME